MCDEPLVVQCIVALTGIPVEVKLGPGTTPLSSPHNNKLDNGSGELLRTSSRQTGTTPRQLTTKDLINAICAKFFSQSITINIMAYPSGIALNESSAIQPLLDAQEQLLLFFDHNMLPKIQVEVPARAREWRDVVQNQRHASKLISTPLATYCDRVQKEAAEMFALCDELKVSMEHIDKILPSLLEKLKETRLLEDSTRTLADMVHADQRSEKAQESLQSVIAARSQREEACTKLKVGLEKAVTATCPWSPEESTAKIEDVEELRSIQKEYTKHLIARFSTARKYMRGVEEQRRNVHKDRQKLNVIKSAYVDRISMLEDLPKAYEEATKLAKRRLALYVATKRVHGTLSIEAQELQAALDVFRKEWGSKLTTNLCPGILYPVNIGGLPVDPLASNLQNSYEDLDDAPSMLLEKLRLAGTGQPSTSRIPHHEKSAEDLAAQQNQQDYDRRLAALTTAHADAESKIKQLEAKLEQLETKNQSLEGKVKQVAEERDGYVANLEQRTLDYEELQKKVDEQKLIIDGLRDVIKTADYATSPRADSTSPPSAATVRAAQGSPDAQLLNKRFYFLHVSTARFVAHSDELGLTLIASPTTSIRLRDHPIGSKVKCEIIKVEDSPADRKCWTENVYSVDIMAVDPAARGSSPTPQH